MNRLYMLLIALFTGLSVSAESLKAQADSAYARERYQEAAGLYEQLLEEGYSPEVYYNLGNCYYRLEKTGPAILNYERALLLDPGDSAIRHNLELARQKTKDKINAAGEIFLVTWYKTVIHWLSVDEWGTLAVSCFILLLVSLALYLFGRDIRLRQVGFYAFVVLGVVCVAANIFAWNQKYLLQNRKGVIVMAPAVTVKSTPSASGTDLFVIHEGTKAEITDPSMKGWKEIRLRDGKTGWVPTESITEI